MITVILVIHILIAVALVALILLQRSEGGALGIGGGSGGGGGGLMTGRAAGNMLTRSTAILATAFMATSMVLAVLAQGVRDEPSLLDRVPEVEETAPGVNVPAPVPGAAVPSIPAASGESSDPAPAAAPAPAAPAVPVVPTVPTAPTGN